MFVALSVVASTAGICSTTYTGDELVNGRFIGSLVLIETVVALSAIGYYEQGTLGNVVQRVELQLRL
jgi:hypothetical protein